MAVRGAERPQEPRPGGEGPEGGPAAERPAWGPSSGPERLSQTDFGGSGGQPFHEKGHRPALVEELETVSRVCFTLLRQGAVGLRCCEDGE